MMEEENKFLELLQLNVNENVEKKGQFKYLSWAWAWAEFLKMYPNATYEIVKNDNGLPFFSDATVGGMVYTKVKAGGITNEMWLPIMDMKNNAKKVFDMMDVNKAVMRCLVKNLAMFGLGLYIYAGEDLPEGETELPKEPAPQKEPKEQPQTRKINDVEVQQLFALIEESGADLEKFCANYKIATLKEMSLPHFQDSVKLLNAKIKNKKANQ